MVDVAKRALPGAAPRPVCEQPLARIDEVAEHLTGVAIVDHGAKGHPEEQVLARGAAAIAPLTVLAARGVIVAPVVVVEQSGQGRMGLQPHAAAIAAVTAVRTPVGNVLLAPEADTAGAPIATLNEDLDLVDEHRGPGGRPPDLRRRRW